jgi:N6-adenosine-specific RNA methylase IME4
MLYKTIVADPPWPITAKMGFGGRRARPTEVPYEFLTIEEIKALPVDELADCACHLYLWSTRRLFREGITVQVARAWGFEPCGEIIWGLRNPGMGGFNGSGHEPVLLASRGNLPWPKTMPAGVMFWKQTYSTNHGKTHSAKPEAFLDCVQQWSPEPRLEMFARQQRLGWHSWGNECLNHVKIPA